MTTQDNIFDFNTRHNLQKQQAQCYHCLHILLVSVCAGSLRVLWVPPTVQRHANGGVRVIGDSNKCE